MANVAPRRNDPIGTALLDDIGKAKSILTRCPECGMVDYRFVNQRSDRSHWCDYTVGGVGRYQCGKCRSFFNTLRIQVPEGMDPMELYERINEMLREE